MLGASVCARQAMVHDSPPAPWRNRTERLAPDTSGTYPLKQAISDHINREGTITRGLAVNAAPLGIAQGWRSDVTSCAGCVRFHDNGVVAAIHEMGNAARAAFIGAG